jgi:hypothetical protein
MKSVAWKGDHPITSYYGWRTDPITGIRSFHDGVDVSMPIGTELYATVNGKVRLATTDSYGGKYIQIQTSDGRGHWCLHLSEFKVKAGDMIQKGNLIGLSGNSGHSTGPHTHFGLQSNATVWSSHIDPLPDLQVLAESARFKKGDRIIFTDIQNIRKGSGIAYDLISKSAVGQIGTVWDEPRQTDGYWWYDIHIDGGGSGWCADVGKFQIYTQENPTNCQEEVNRLLEQNRGLSEALGASEAQVRESQEERKRLEGLLEAEKIESKELEARYKDLEEKRKRLEGEKNEAVRLLNEYKNGRFVWIVDFLEKLFPKKK